METGFVDRFVDVVQKTGWSEFVLEQVGSGVSVHKRIRFAIAGCANGCSRPQIVDFGLLRAVLPNVEPDACTGCGFCTGACPEGSVSMEPAHGTGVCVPLIDRDQCLLCGRCSAACPEGAMRMTATGWRVVVGGRLGRLPVLARELPGLYDDDAVLQLVDALVRLFMQHWKPGLRLGVLLEELGFENVVSACSL
ncbi:4Fe-4S binding protein [Paucidesulfovibrio gracilis]|nr:4Fe-4S binding protein [Paucidesulfovibrio gracilis]